MYAIFWLKRRSRVVVRNVFLSVARRSAHFAPKGLFSTRESRVSRRLKFATNPTNESKHIEECPKDLRLKSFGILETLTDAFCSATTSCGMIASPVEQFRPNLSQIQKIEEESDEERIQSTQQNRRRALPSEDESEEDVGEEAGDEEMVDVEPDSQDQVVKKLVRYALACEFQRTSIKRVGITEKG
jgi:hypothetical protein